MKAIVDEERCFGCGVCEATCPDVSLMGDANNKAKVKLDPVPQPSKKAAAKRLNPVQRKRSRLRSSGDLSAYLTEARKEEATIGCFPGSTP